MTAPQPPEQLPAWRAFIKRRPLLSFFTLCITLSWVAWIPYIVGDHGLGIEDIEVGDPGTAQILLMLPGAYLGPIFSAFLVTAVADGREGVRKWVGRLFRWRVGLRWYALALLGVPAALVLCSLVFSGGAIQAPPTMALLMFLPGLVMQFLTTGIAEEPGWRDFALPRMQPLFGPLLGTVILGLIWGVWHLPLFVTQWAGYPEEFTWLAPVEFTISCVAISIVMTWVFNRTGESLPVAILLHAGVNNFMSIVYGPMFPSIDNRAMSAHVMLLAFGIAAVVLLITTKGKLGYVPVAEEPGSSHGSHEPGENVQV